MLAISCSVAKSKLATILESSVMISIIRMDMTILKAFIILVINYWCGKNTISHAH